MLKTKREQVIEALINEDYIKAMKLAKHFHRDLTKEQNTIVTRAYEMQWNSTFYEMLGYNKEEEFEKAINILKDIYLSK